MKARGKKTIFSSLGRLDVVQCLAYLCRSPSSSQSPSPALGASALYNSQQESHGRVANDF